MNGSNYVKFPMRSSVIVIFEIDDEYCFFLSILAGIDPFESSNPKRVWNYREYIEKLALMVLILVMAVVMFISLKN